MFRKKILQILVISGFLLFLTSCRVHYNINDEQTVATVVRLDSLTVAADDSASLAIIAPYKASMQEQMDEVLGYSERAMSKDQPEGLLNNFVADVVLNMANKYYQPADGLPIDLCLLNNGGLRSDLPKGELKMRNIYELMPFENKLVVLTLTGAKTGRLFDYIAHEGGLPVSGLKMGIRGEKAVNILVNTFPFDSTRNYKVVTSDYLAEGGDKMSFFQEPAGREEMSQKLREAIADYLRALTATGKTVDVKLDKRVYYE
jgi:2',3'-cyclic-nucleotide 2'-phosphodiesterase (5'-nucleotidase family)